MKHPTQKEFDIAANVNQWLSKKITQKNIADHARVIAFLCRDEADRFDEAKPKKRKNP